MEIWDEIKREKDPRRLILLGKKLWFQLEQMQPSELLEALRLISSDEFEGFDVQHLCRKIVERLGPEHLVALIGSGIKLSATLVWYVETQIWVIPAEVPDPPFGAGVNITENPVDS
jgi:hypothetical protein